jgi:hypothetical protein
MSRQNAPEIVFMQTEEQCDTCRHHVRLLRLCVFCWVDEVRNTGLVLTEKCETLGMWNSTQWNLHLRFQETADWNTVLRKLLINSEMIDLQSLKLNDKWTGSIKLRNTKEGLHCKAVQPPNVDTTFKTSNTFFCSSDPHCMQCHVKWL